MEPVEGMSLATAKSEYIDRMLAERRNFIQLLNSVLGEDIDTVLWCKIHNALKKAGQLR